MIADMEANKKLHPIFIELPLRGRKLKTSLDILSKSYFRVPKTKRVNATHYFFNGNISQKRIPTNTIKSFYCRKSLLNQKT